MHDQRDELRPGPEAQTQRGRPFRWSLLMWVCLIFAGPVLYLGVMLIARFVFGFKG
jgi:energy-converting hydrogenase Eha subunit A